MDIARLDVDYPRDESRNQAAEHTNAYHEIVAKQEAAKKAKKKAAKKARKKNR